MVLKTLNIEHENLFGHKLKSTINKNNLEKSTSN